MVSKVLYAVHKQNTMYKMKRIRFDIMADSFTRHTANDAVTTSRYYDVTSIVGIGTDATDLPEKQGSFFRRENIEKYNVLKVSRN